MLAGPTGVWRQALERQPVRSSSVASIGYDGGARVLEVEFSNGSVYQYVDVPTGVYESLMQAPSIGRYMHANVRDRYRYTQVR